MSNSSNSELKENDSNQDMECTQKNFANLN